MNGYNLASIFAAFGARDLTAEEVYVELAKVYPVADGEMVSITHKQLMDLMDAAKPRTFSSTWQQAHVCEMPYTIETNPYGYAIEVAGHKWRTGPDDGQWHSLLAALHRATLA